MRLQAVDFLGFLNGWSLNLGIEDEMVFKRLPKSAIGNSQCGNIIQRR